MSTPTQEFVYPCPPLRLGLFDLGGVLYHANYFSLYEQAREAMLAELGFPYPMLCKGGRAHLAILESHQRFLRPVRYGDTIHVHLQLRDFGSSSFVIDYLLRSDAFEKVIHEAWTKMVYVEAKNGDLRPGKLPPAVREALTRYSSLRTT